MMISESIWIGDKILKLIENSTDFRLLNIGSSTRQFREKEEPWIQENIFTPIYGICSVDHLDMKAQDGVDIIGDLNDIIFLEQLKLKYYDAILCSNLLEHVLNPEDICRGMEDCVNEGGFLIVTVPCLYPYHNDPIDTMFRPDVEELVNYFKKSSLVEGEILTMDNNHMKALLCNRKLLFLTIIRWFSPFYKFNAWKKKISDIPNTFKDYKVTCILMKKNTFYDIN